MINSYLPKIMYGSNSRRSVIVLGISTPKLFHKFNDKISIYRLQLMNLSFLQFYPRHRNK